MEHIALDFGPLETNSVPNFSGQSLADVLNDLLPYIFYFSGFALLIYLIIGGYKYLFAAGNPKSIQSAKSQITNALVGILLVFVSYWIVQILGYFFGVGAFNILSP